MPEASASPERYSQTPIQVKIEGDQIPVETHIDLREPTGEVFLRNGARELLAPASTDFPIASGDHIQLVDRSLKSSELRESPILSDSADVKDILSLVRMGIITQRQMVDRSGNNVWANLNLHSRPPMSADAPIDAQYDSLTLDVHGRDISDASNWAMPPPIHGGWAADAIKDVRGEIERLKESVDESGNVVPATPDEIEKYKHDPDRRKTDQSSARVQRPEEYQGWRQDSEGGYHWEGARRRYTAEELANLRSMFGTSQFMTETTKLDNVGLFPDLNPPLEHFEPNDTDMVLWEFGGYQLVTQKVPLVDSDEGIHMVLKLRPEPHTPWDNPRQTLEAYAIGLGVARLLKNTKVLGDIGDAYLDMNANWSMGRKRDDPALQGLSAEQIKEAIQKDTRAHLHIQLEKMTAAWEIPPAPGTFKDNKPQSPESIEEIRGVLNNSETGLNAWIVQNATGSLPK